MNLTNTQRHGSGHSYPPEKYLTDTLTSAASATFGRETSKATLSATSSLESLDGRSRSSSLSGRQMSLFGQVAAPVSHSAQPGSSAEQRTSGISGPCSEASLRSARLQLSLESRLRARLAAYGSRVYDLTWKHWDMRSGGPICALRASVRTISDSGFSGWQTPTVQDAHGRDRHNQRNGKVILSTLGQACLYGWGTPTSRDHKDGSSVGSAPENGLLGRQVWQFSDGTEGIADLNPAFHLWLQGYPPQWHSLGEAAIQSCLNSQRNSLKRGPK